VTAPVPSPDEPGARLWGVTVGLVTNNKDPDGMGRVKLRLPWLADQFETDWARVASPMAGKARGIYMLPEVDDEVLVGFEHGRLESPFVLGALWNGQEKPPESNSDGKNDRRSLTSRSGHVIRLTDTAGEERIEILDKSGKNSLVLDTKSNTVTVTADADVVIRATQGMLVLSGEKGVELSSKGGVKISAAQDVDVKASTQLVLKGQTVDIN
jgi:phage baseplate assembly protein V